jgi:hypothetical protein
VVLHSDQEYKKMKMVEKFLYAEENELKTRKEMLKQRQDAKAELDGVVRTREERVDPVLIEILKTNYGVDFNKLAKGKSKLGVSTMTEDQINGLVQRLYDWARDCQIRKENMAAELEDIQIDECPFAPMITDASRDIYAQEKEKILTKRQLRQKELDEKRALRAKIEEAKYKKNMTFADRSHSAFSRRPVQKRNAAGSKETPKKEPQAIAEPADDSVEKQAKPADLETTNDETKTYDSIHRRREKGFNNDLELLRNQLDATLAEGELHKKPGKVSSDQADTFHKHMMEWNDRKEKHRTQKTVEYWVNNFENSGEKDSFKPTIHRRKVRTREDQKAHAQSLINTLKQKETELEEERENQIKGLFQPKVTHYIPPSVANTFTNKSIGKHTSRDPNDADSVPRSGVIKEHIHPINLVYYSRNATKSKSPLKNQATPSKTQPISITGEKSLQTSPIRNKSPMKTSTRVTPNKIKLSPPRMVTFQQNYLSRSKDVHEHPLNIVEVPASKREQIAHKFIDVAENKK